MSIYKEAAFIRLRFQTSAGLVPVEDLTDLSIPELDKLAIDAETEYKESGKKSFVAKKSPKDKVAKLKFDIILDVLTTKVELEDTQLNALENKKFNANIDAIIARKEGAALEEMSVEELQGMRKA